MSTDPPAAWVTERIQSKDDARRLLDEYRAHRYRESFLEFMTAAWSTIEPTRALLPSIALIAICAALQAVAEGRIKRLAIACPPGVSKSLAGAVGFPAWLLLRTLGTARIMVGSYSWSFAERDSRRCRDLIGSDWYQTLVAGTWSVRDDADTRSDYSTTSGGRRLIASVGGKALGERATFQIVDDALSGADVHSRAAKDEASRWLTEVLPSRLEDPNNDPCVIIGQRLCIDDPIATALALGRKLLNLPAMLVEGDVPCVLLDDHGVEVWRDTRKIGEPLVALLGPEALARLKLELGSTPFAAQYGQRPADDGAAVIKRAWWRFHRAPHVEDRAPRPAGCDETTFSVETPESFDRVVITADLTFGSTTGDFAVAQAWGAKGGARYLLEQWRERAGFEASRAAIAKMAARYPGAKIVIEKAANGAAVIETLSAVVPGVVAVKPIGNKEQRLSAAAPAVESGSCYLPLGAAWLGEFVEELAGATKHDDSMDSAAYAIRELAYGAALSDGLAAPRLRVRG